MSTRMVANTDLRKGHVLALPMGRTATIANDPKVGRQYVRFRTEYGLVRVEKTDETLVEVPESTREFTVSWTMHLEGVTHRDAAMAALRVLMDSDPENIGKVFEVEDLAGVKEVIDLSPGAHGDDDLSTDR